MKTKEELNALKNDVEALNRKLAELTDDEMKQVTGGFIPIILPYCSSGDRQVFIGKSDGSSKAVQLNIGLGPQEYDCSGLVD